MEERRASAAEIVLDTSALGLLEDAPVRDRFVQECQSRGTVVVVPIVSLGECLEDPRLEAAEQRAAAIADAFERLGGGRFGIDTAGILRREWRGAAPSRTPRLRPKWQEEWLRQQLRWLPRIGGSELLEAIKAYHGKDETFATDQEVRSAIPERFPEVKSADLRQFMDDLPGYILRNGNPFLDGTTLSPKHRRRVRKHPNRFRATLMLATYFCLNALGASFVGPGFDRYHEVLKTPQRGSWVDARIAACAAYGDVFLSDDRNQRAKFNFIATEFGWPVRASCFKAWASSTGA